MIEWASIARAVATAAVLVLPGTGLGALVHFAHESHAVCHLHGELVHVPESSGVPTAATSVTPGNDHPSKPHHHCTLGHASHDPNAAIPQHPELGFEGPPPSEPFLQTAGQLPIPPLDLAPKASPPAQPR